MKRTFHTSINTAAMASLTLFAGSANAALLSVDFQNSNGVNIAGVTQSGFVAFNNTHSTGTSGTATYGIFNVTISGLQTLSPTIEGLFNRDPGIVNSGGFTFANIYNDFAFNNTNTPITLQLTGAGIAPSTAYDLTFYSYDKVPAPTNVGTRTVTVSGVSGTTGSPAVINTTPTITPTSNSQYASTSRFTSNAAGVLTVSVADAGIFEANWGPRLNAFQLDLAPAAGPMALKVDFNDTIAGGGPSPTESGFVSFQEVGNPGSRLFTTPQGSLIVTVAGHETATVGGFFDRGAPADSGAFTNGELYRDFLFHNSGGTISLAIDGVKPGAQYEMIFYSSDLFAGTTFPINITNEIVAVLNTSGASGQISYSRLVGATSNLEHSFTGLFTSTTSTLNFEVRSLLGNQTRLNGFELREIIVIPEPATATLSMLALGGMFMRRRRLSEI